MVSAYTKLARYNKMIDFKIKLVLVIKMRYKYKLKLDFWLHNNKILNNI